MSIEWDKIGERKYETGTDRGVLYPKSAPGVPWNGLLAVRERSVGDATTPYYYDGQKYLNEPAPTDFEATIDAFTYPDEFEVCQGSDSFEIGMFVSQQRQEEFGLSYRTMVGNDLEGSDHGYKVHLVYNALAVPSEKAYASINGSVAPSTFSWAITTTPVEWTGLRPSAHLVADSTKVSPFGMTVLESILYGLYNDARLPDPSEFAAIPWESRYIIVIEHPNADLLPDWALPGDTVFSISDTSAYSVDVPPSDESRPVFVVDDISDIDYELEGMYPGDLVYDESTGTIYKLGA